MPIYRQESSAGTFWYRETPGIAQLVCEAHKERPLLGRGEEWVVMFNQDGVLSWRQYGTGKKALEAAESFVVQQALIEVSK